MQHDGGEVFANYQHFCREGDRTNVLGEYTSMRGEIGVIPKKIQLSHEGYLECVASVQNNSAISPTVSQTHYLKVIGESL